MVDTGRIFISYRRDDSSDYSARLFDALASEFGADVVFMDNETIRKGVDDWEERILRELEAAVAIVAIIGPRWATLERDGRRRLEFDDDWVRRELRSGLERNVPVIPATPKLDTIPPADVVPDDIRSVVTKQAIEIRSEYLKADCAPLCALLRELVPSLTPPDVREPRRRRRWPYVVLFVLALAGAMSAAWLRSHTSVLAPGTTVRVLHEVVEVSRVPFAPESGTRDNLVVRLRVNSTESAPVRLSGERVLRLSKGGEEVGVFKNRSDALTLQPDETVELFWDLLVPVDVVNQLPTYDAVLEVPPDPVAVPPGPGLTLGPMTLKPESAHAGLP